MANPQRGEVDLVIGRTTYMLKIGLNAMCEIEEALSTKDRPVTFAKALEGAMTGNAGFMRAVLWGALRRYHPNIGIVNVEDLLDEAGGWIAFVPIFTPVLNRLLDYSKPDEADRGAVKLAPAAAAAAAAGGAGRPPEDPATGTITTPSISRRVKSA